MDVKLPEIGEGVTEGELVKWLVKVGDAVKADQPIVEIMTDKATVEVPSPTAGKVTALKAKEGDTIAVHGVLLTLEAGGAPAAKAPAPVKTTPEPKLPPPPMQAVVAHHAVASAAMDVYPPAADLRVLATPSTRRLAREMGVDINSLKGTGLAGRVTREDVASRGNGGGAVAKSHGAVEERTPLRGIRRKVAEKMQLSKQIIPHFTLMDEANVTELVKLRGDLKEKLASKNVKITYLPFVMKALIATLKDFPEANASIDDAAQEIVVKRYYNLGFAADTPQGLVVPVIKDANHKSILDISQEIVTLSEKARAGKLAIEDLKGSTISITNIGSVSGTYATPIINHPEVAILGMYKIQEKPVIKNGALSSIQVMNFTITCDHRLIDGAVAARFLKAFIERIENPGLLMMDLA